MIRARTPRLARLREFIILRGLHSGGGDRASGHLQGLFWKQRVKRGDSNAAVFVGPPGLLRLAFFIC